MHVLTDWSIDASSGVCCATIEFAYDTPPALIKLDAGDTMTYDKTEVCETETYHYPFTCGSVAQSFWSENGGGEIVAIGSSPKPNNLPEGTQPTYDCCPTDPLTPTSIATITKTVRSRGGQRFVVQLQASSISVTIIKAEDYVCTPAAAVTKYIIRSTIHYTGAYLYINYNELSTTYVADEGLTDIDCWEVPADTVVGSPTFDINDYDSLIGASVDITSNICREKVLASLPVTETNYTFHDVDIPDVGCVFDECISCDPDLPCWTSGPTGDEEPVLHFCDATSVTAESESGSINVCGVNRYYFWAVNAGCYPDGFVYISVPQNMHMCCDSFASPSNPGDYCDTLNEWAGWTTAHPGYGDIGGECAYMVPKDDADWITCFPTYACDECPTPADQVGDSDPDLAVGVVTSDPINYSLQYRIISETRTVTCSGYTEQEVCQEFGEWTITVTPPPTVTPATATLTLAGYAPTVSTPNASTPTTAGLTLAVFAPSVNLPGTYTPSDVALVLTTFVPTVSTPITTTPSTAALSLTTFAPTVATPIVATPDKLTLMISRFVPTVTVPGDITVSPVTEFMSLATFIPTIITPTTLTPTTATLTITSFVPTVTTPSTVTPTTATLSITSFVPTIILPNVVIPDTSTLTLTTFVPTVTLPIVAIPPTIALVLTTYVPTVTGTVACPSDPCEWIWVEASWEWIEDTFNCADALYDDCICNNPPTRAGTYDTERLVTDDCLTVPVETPIPIRRSLFLTTFEPTVS